MNKPYSVLYTITIVLSLVSSISYAQNNGANNIQSLMLYRSFIQDAQDCSVSIKNKQPVFAKAVAGSAAASCPDAFAWTQFLSAINNHFWNWGLDQTVWPQKPWPLCQGKKTKKCCNPDELVPINSKKFGHCPYNRQDYKQPTPLPAQPGSSPGGAVINHRGLNVVDKLDPGRLLRDLELELVFRNKPMIDYIYKKNLYNTNGLAAVNQQQNKAISKGDIGKAQRLQIRFPIDAVMVKADFIHQDIMLNQGLIRKKDKQGKKLVPPQNPDYPYLTVEIKGSGKAGDVPGLYYMVAMTNASKALPIWHWYAMEHVANRGRCDYVGCNDSYGYTVNGKAQAGADFGPHFIAPKTVLNNDRASGNDPLFDTGKVYLPPETGEKITKDLQQLYKGMGIAIDKKDRDYKVISPTDPAWLSYRLKGTQSSFTTANGVPTGTGATVTEGGFVNSASCATCHSQAAVNSSGGIALQGVGATWRPNLFGYQQVVMGSPDMDWFYNPGTEVITATQVDFVWGILNAQPLAK